MPIDPLDLETVTGGVSPDAYAPVGSPEKCAWLDSAISHRLAAKSPNLRKGVAALQTERADSCK